MAYIKPGYISSRSYPHNYWQDRFPYWPCFEQKSHAEVQEKEPQSIIVQSEICFRACINSEVKIDKRNLDELLLISEDLYICEN